MRDFNFAVVQFTIDQSVNTVPQNWVSLDETKCLWPNDPSSKKIKRSVVPAPDWTSFDITILKKYGNDICLYFCQSFHIHEAFRKSPKLPFIVILYKLFIDDYESARKCEKRSINQSDLDSTDVDAPRRKKQFIETESEVRALTAPQVEIPSNSIEPLVEGKWNTLNQHFSNCKI